jgi:nitrite reductase (cytochrome c-552)
LIGDIKAEKSKGATDTQLASARDYQRKGQFMIDFVMSENSMGFHAPQEATRILGDAINFCRLGQLSLHGGPPPSHNPPNIVNITGAPPSTANPSRQGAKEEKSATIAQLQKR